MTDQERFLYACFADDLTSPEALPGDDRDLRPEPFPHYWEQLALVMVRPN